MGKLTKGIFKTTSELYQKLVNYERFGLLLFLDRENEIEV